MRGLGKKLHGKGTPYTIQDSLKIFYVNVINFANVDKGKGVKSLSNKVDNFPFFVKYFLTNIVSIIFKKLKLKRLCSIFPCFYYVAFQSGKALLWSEKVMGKGHEMCLFSPLTNKTPHYFLPLTNGLLYS